MEPTLKILIVEDNPGDVLIVREHLKSSGLNFTLSHAVNLKDSLKLCSENIFDVILLDLGLPDSTGIETLRELYDSKVGSPLVVMTGLDDEEVALEALRVGAQDYLVKNRLTTDALVKSVKYSIERRKIQELLRLSEERYRKLTRELEQKVKERTSDLEHLNQKLHKELRERIQVEGALRKNEVQLKELNATKDKFFNIVAHDLKNPFTSLLGSSELLFQNIEQLDHDNIKKLAIILNDSAKGGYAILQNLLDWSRSQTGMLRMNPENLNLKNLVDENVVNLDLLAMNKQIEILCHVSSDILVYGDKNMINTVLRNLISNALKFSHPSSKIIISAFKANDEVVVSVKDFGTGIASEDIPKLFRIDTKFSLPGTENEQGTGLGLKLSKEFVEKQGGKIWVVSEVAKGSEFMFSIARQNGHAIPN